AFFIMRGPPREMELAQGPIRRYLRSRGGAMKTDSIRVSAVLPAEPKAVYDAWMSSKGHAAMTGSPAKITARVGGAFSAWDGYISGKNLELEQGARILQSW